MQYIYQIKNSDYETKKVVAPDMGAALYKYKKHLDEHIYEVNYSPQETYEKVTSCELVGEYENDMIM